MLFEDVVLLHDKQITSCSHPEALFPLSHTNSQSAQFVKSPEILRVKVENCSGEVNSKWILIKLGIHVPKTVFY